jgi:hypothetical protein
MALGRAVVGERTEEKRRKEEEDKVSVGPTRDLRRILTVAPVTRPGAALHSNYDLISNAM